MSKLGNKVLEKTGDFGVRHQKFLNWGLSAILGGVAYELAKYGLPSGNIDGNFFLHFSAFFTAFPVAIATLFNTKITFDTGKNTNSSLPEYFSIQFLRKSLNAQKEKVKPFKDNTLTFEENQINETCSSFFTSLFIVNRPMSRLNYVGIDHSKLPKFNLDTFHYYKKPLQNLYEQEFKHTLVLPRCILLSMEGDKYAKELVPILWELNGNHITEKQVKYLIKTMESNSFSFGDKPLKKTNLVSLFGSQNIFKTLPFMLQEKVIEAAREVKMSQVAYDNLVNIHKAQDEFKSVKETKKSEEKPIVEKTSHEIENVQNRQPKSINPESQEKLDTFEKRFNALYAEEDEVLTSIEQLMLNKENMAYFLENFDKHHQYVEAQLFLKNDVDRVVQAFHDEVNVLMKMKLTKHPKFDEKKAIVLEAMVERVHLIEGKMLEINERLHDNIEQELDSKLTVNQAVLKAKV
jgi:hypothetical protein